MNETNAVTQNNPGLTVAVMAKAAVPGRVKTRLTRGKPAISPQQAAAVHREMFGVVLERLAGEFTGQYGPDWTGILAMDDPSEAPTAGEGWELVEQGGGDLGQRLDRVWRESIEKTGREAIVFFGVDSPDVPAEVLRSIGPALEGADAGIGPVADGGYWTLACGRYLPGLLRGIDWGTPAVYDQTVAAAARLGVSLHALTAWHDVDEPDDLLALLRRLDTAEEPVLQRLAERLKSILQIETT